MIRLFLGGKPCVRGYKCMEPSLSIQGCVGRTMHNSNGRLLTIPWPRATSLEYVTCRTHGLRVSSALYEYVTYLALHSVQAAPMVW
jgi:hypothetical protein